MSDTSSDSDDGILFQDRPSNANFQERLMQAKSSMEFDPMDQDARFMDFFDSDDTATLKDRLEQLSKKVLQVESRVEEKEQKLRARRQERDMEAGLTNMTTEERAAYVAQQEETEAKLRKQRQQLRKNLLNKDMRQVDRGRNSNDEDEEESDQEEEEEAVPATEAKPNWDAVYEYMLLLENENQEDELTFGTDFVSPNARMRREALTNEQVTKQTEYSGIVVQHAIQTFEDDIESGTGEVRHCTLSGTSFDLPFKVKYDVREPSMVIANLDFEVDIEMELAVGSTLQKIKNECHLLGFFRLLVHYAKLENSRKDIFNQLTNHYKNTPVNVVMLSQNKLQFEGAADCGINLLFSWKLVETHTDREKLDANVTNDVQPDLSMEAVALPAVIAKDANGALDKVKDAFIHALMQKGVYQGTKYIVDNILFNTKQ
ncbi:hypothetical protein MAM1_0139d06359 [Mucor ambiguus]|uniref:Uncharacterized protein n=1 Tax=Mucor ambiguus TaxID=91626 RepID=A0A0C9MHS8_9FUNG|nr:hypothetical protein MAM1_0139d06359 [Mucor ambiguus]